MRRHTSRCNLQLVYAIVTVKKAAAQTYQSLNIKPETYAAIEKACNQVLSGQHDDQFQVDALQGGAGTTTHMNVNEVLASLAGPGVHPLDDVNRGQSTNDVYPTALRIAAIRLLRSVSEECAKLQQALQRKELEFDHIQKLGRTELMDAVPITLGEEFGAYAQAIARDRWRIYKKSKNGCGRSILAVPRLGKPIRRNGVIDLQLLKSCGN